MSKKLIFVFSFILLSLSGFGESFELEENQILVDGKLLQTLEQINEHLSNGSKIFLGPGKYTEGLIIDKDNVLLSGFNAHFIAAIKEEKATFVVKGDNVVIEGIECSQVSVSHKNGACVRQEGKNLTLESVYFHHSQQGVLQASNTGDLTIRNSKFERLGFAGRAHAVYTNGDSLNILNSKFIASKDQAHAIKSRSKKTLVVSSIISSGDADDSRLFDISNGGELEIKSSILYQGVNTVNSQLIGFGLENLGRQRAHKIEISDSIILAERPNGNRLILKNQRIENLALSIKDSLIIGRYNEDISKFDESNFIFESRKRIGLKDNVLPSLNILEAAKLGLLQ